MHMMCTLISGEWINQLADITISAPVPEDTATLAEDIIGASKKESQGYFA